GLPTNPHPSPPSPSGPVSPAPSNAEVAYQEARKAVDLRWATCSDKSGTNYLFAKVVPAKAAPNPFTPALVPPDADQAFGYYQFSTPITCDREAIRLTIAD